MRYKKTENTDNIWIYPVFLSYSRRQTWIIISCRTTSCQLFCQVHFVLLLQYSPYTAY